MNDPTRAVCGAALVTLLLAPLPAGEPMRVEQLPGGRAVVTLDTEQVSLARALELIEADREGGRR